MKQEVETIERRVYSTGQDQRYEHYFSYTDSNILCRIFIKSGMRKGDCEAFIFVLDKQTYEWRKIYFIPSQLMKTEDGLQFTNKNYNITHFRLDEINLMDKLEKLLRKEN